MEVEELSANAVQPSASASTAHSVRQNVLPASTCSMKTVIKYLNQPLIKLPEIMSTLQKEQFDKWCRRYKEERKMQQKAANNSDVEPNDESPSKKILKLTLPPDLLHSIEFTRSLKQYKYKDVVIGFNHKKICLRCKLDSREYNFSLNFDVMFKELF